MGQLCLSTYLYNLENEPSQRQVIKKKRKLRGNRFCGIIFHPSYIPTLSRLTSLHEKKIELPGITQVFQIHAYLKEYFHSFLKFDSRFFFCGLLVPQLLIELCIALILSFKGRKKREILRNSDTTMLTTIRLP